MWADAVQMLSRAVRLHRQLFRPGPRSAAQACWEPPVDVLETDREVLILAALPGVDPDAVETAIEDGVLKMGHEAGKWTVLVSPGHWATIEVQTGNGSDEDKDRLAAYEHHANSYVRKPIDYDEFVAASRQLGLYWLLLNRPAPRRRA